MRRAKGGATYAVAAKKNWLPMELQLPQTLEKQTVTALKCGWSGLLENESPLFI